VTDDELEALFKRQIWFDRFGRPITFRQWAELLENLEYKFVGDFYTDDGKWRVSTVWLGIDSGFNMGGPPMLFETMVFWHGQGRIPRRKRDWDQSCVRYQTFAEAEQGHAATVTNVKAGRSPFDWREKPFNWL
jgi:hypothetical protein